MKRILRSEQPADWLVRFAERFAATTPVRTAMKSEDLNALVAWNNEPAHDMNSLTRLRAVLGKIFSHLNEISHVYNYGNRTPTPNFVQRAQQLVPDLQNLPSLKQALMATEQVLGSKFPAQPAMPALTNMIHAIQQINFTPQQSQALQALSSGQTQQQGYRYEAAPENMRKMLKEQIYGTGGSPSKNTLTVLREVLQNACDAVVNPANKMRDPNHVPTITVVSKDHRLPTSDGKDETMLDLVIADNGIGMNWAVLSQKFFIYFESGKEDQGGVSTGGFGIAKAKIQETPEHGWAIDTNGIHSSRFGRNMYLGTQINEAFEPPKSTIQQSGTGTVLSLFGLPYATESDMRELCANYAMGQVKIIINGSEIKPRLNLTDVQKVDGNLSVLPQVISDEPAEQQVAQVVSQKSLQSSGDSWLGDLNFNPLEGKSVQIEFGLRRRAKDEYVSGGKMFVLVNGQYQFDKDEWIHRADIVCNVATNLTPKDKGYPVDPGRENLTQPYQTAVNKTVQFLKKILEEISKDAVFKDGLDINVFNGSFQPLKVSDESDAVDAQADAMREQLADAMGLRHDEMFPETPEEPETPEAAETPATPAQPAVPTAIAPAPVPPPPAVAPPEQVAEMLTEAISKVRLDQQQTEIAKVAIEALKGDNRKRLNVKDEFQRIIQGLTTPAAVMIQKNFVSRKSLDENPDVTRNLMLLWQAVISKVVKQCGKLLHSNWEAKEKQYAPGLIFSNEALGLHVPKNATRRMAYDTVAINPISIASIVEPEAFEKAIGSEDVQSRSQEHGLTDDTGIKDADRLTSFIMHVATHEVTHLLWPEYGYGAENFHRKVTAVEIACHFMEPEIKAEVRRHLKGVRSDMKKMMRIIAKDRKLNPRQQV